MGFTFDPKDYHPMHLSLLSFIESEFRYLESKDLREKQAKAQAQAKMRR